MKTVLICGGSGFIGSNFVRLMLSRRLGVRVINTDKLTYSGSRENLKDIEHNKRYVFIKKDIAQQGAMDAIFKKYKPQYVINFAAETHVDRSIHRGAEEFVKTNIGGVLCLLEAAKKFGGVEKFVHVSTDEVYGSLELDSKKLFSEKTPLRPNSPYAASKAGGDLLCVAYFATWGIPVVVTRCSNNFGPHQYPEKLIPFFVLRMIAGKKLPLYGDGKNVRDWIYVQDHCRALELCLFTGRPGEIYNIGASNERSNLEIAKMTLRYFNKNKSDFEFVADRPGHDRRYAIDSSKIEKELGWRPRYSFEEAFRATLDWYMHNRTWLEVIRKKAKKINAHIKIK